MGGTIPRVWAQKLKTGQNLFFGNLIKFPLQRDENIDSDPIFYYSGFLAPEFPAPPGNLAHMIFIGYTLKLMKNLILPLLIFLSAWLLPLPAPAGELPMAEDFQQDASDAQDRGVVIMVMFSSDSCSYCEVVREDYMIPMVGDVEYENKVIIRIVDIEGSDEVVGFNGQKQQHTEFADAQGVSLVPTIKFYGPGGKELASELIGYSNEHFYGYYLDSKIDESLAALKALAYR